MNNNFTEEIRELFMWNRQKCWICGMNHADCLHHIMGRGGGSSKLESSPLNASPVNNIICHLGRNMGDIVICKMLLKKTYDYLINNCYKFTEKDKLFIEKYNKFYAFIN